MHYGTAHTVSIETDEDGFTLTLEGVDEGDGIVRVNVNDVAESLYDTVRAAIEPWLMERNAAKAEFDRMKRAGDTRRLTDQQFSDYLDDVYGDDWAKRVLMEQMRESGHA